MAAPTAVGNVANVILPSPKDLPIIGGLYIGATSIAAPTTLYTDAAAINTAGWKHLGFVSEDGIEENEDRPTDSIFAWGRDLVAKPQTSYDLTVSYTLYEFLRPDVAKLAYGDENVTVTAATVSTGTKMSIIQTSEILDMKSLLLDSYAPGGKRFQKYFSLAQVTNRDSQKTSHKEVLSHRITQTFYPDAVNRYALILTDDGVFDAS